MNSTETSPKLTKSLEDRQNLSAGHQAMMLQNTRRKLRDNWKNTKAYRQHMLAGALGKTPQEIDGDGASEEDENMLRDALVLGNVTITQSAQLPQEKRTEQSLLAPESPAVQRSEPPAPMSTAAKIGMAAAIAHWFNGKEAGERFFHDTRYQPNLLVYDKVLCALKELG